MPMEDLIATAHDVTGSRVLDVIFTSPTVAFKDQRKFVTHFIGHYHELVDDRIGSRVGDNCWAFADPYLRVCLVFITAIIAILTLILQEKIARSLIPHEMTLVGSFYGKFFARNLNLYLLKKNPEQWKTAQAARKAALKIPTASDEPKEPAATPQGPEKSAQAPPALKNKKRKARPTDEIDEVFETLGKKVKRAELKADEVDAPAKTDTAKEAKKEKKRRKRDDDAKDKELEDVLGAIKAAPKDEKRHKHKKKS